MTTMVGMPGGWELIAIILVIVLLFGAKKLPELARGSGQALRIFKSETKGLKDDDEKPADGPATREQRELQAREAGSTDAERTRHEHGDGTTA